MTEWHISGKLLLFGATMEPLHWQGALAATFFLILIGGCGEKSSSTTSTAPSAATPAPPAAVQPAPATDSVSPKAGAAGPAAGGTAIGGMVTQQEQGTTKKGDTPAPTSGDGATK